MSEDGNGEDKGAPQKPKELTPEQKAIVEASKKSMNKFMGSLSYYMVHQMRTIINGTININVDIDNFLITGAEFHATTKMDFTEKEEPGDG